MWRVIFTAASVNEHFGRSCKCDRVRMKLMVIMNVVWLAAWPRALGRCEGRNVRGDSVTAESTYDVDHCMPLMAGFTWSGWGMGGAVATGNRLTGSLIV